MLQQNQGHGGTSFDRPLPYCRRADLDIAWVHFRGVRHAVVKDPLSLKYLQLAPDQYAVLDLVDGRRSLRQVRDDLQSRFPTEHFALPDVQGVVMDLQEKGLLAALRLGQGPALLKSHRDQRRKKIFAALRNPLSIQFPGWDPDRFLTAATPYVGWIFHPAALAISATVIAGALLFLGAHFQDVQNRMPEFERFFGWPNLLYLWITLAAIKVLHELGHGLACKYFGRECHSIGVMLLVFSPTMYCDVTDAWMIPGKWPRILISAAGMYFETLLSTIALLVWWNTEPGMLHYLCLNTFFVSTVSTVVFNANPLMRYDGYYILSDLLEIPNLRQKGDQVTQQAMARLCWGIELPATQRLPESGRFWFILYVVTSAIYRWVVFAGIITFFYTVLKPYRLQSLGILLAVATLLMTLGSTAFSAARLIRQPRRDPASWTRLTVTAIVVGLLVYAGMFIPVPWYVEAPFYVEPEGAAHLYNPVQGTVAKVFAEPGAEVAEGATVLVLSDPELEAKVDEAKVQAVASAAEVEAYEAAGRPDAAAVAREKATSTREHLRKVTEEADRLILRAPIAGRIIAPPRVAEASLEQERERLPAWAGIPITHRNAGSFLQPQTHVATIAPTEQLQAVLVMDQTEREELVVGRPVRLKLEELPKVVLDGRIAEVSHRHLEFAPRGLSNRYQGPLVTVTDDQGREKLTSVTYQAVVPLDVDPARVRTGMRGTARVHLFDRSLGTWIWRLLRTTFQFRL